MFNFTNFTVQEKLDGSLAILYYYKNQWRFNTRGSFANGKPCDFSQFTWSELFFNCLDNSKLQFLDKNCSYVFEFCSIYNKIVIEYKNPTLFLLSIFNNDNNKELDIYDCDIIANIINVQRPKIYNFSNIENLINYLESQEKVSIEGFVIRDIHNNRLKIKHSKYLCLHRLRGESGNLYSPKNLIPFILGTPEEREELIAYFPEVQTCYDKLKTKINEIKSNIFQLWEKAKPLTNQKDFAMMVKDTVGAGFLFNARKMNKDINEVWKDQAEDFLTKYFKEHKYE